MTLHSYLGLNLFLQTLTEPDVVYVTKHLT